MQQIDVGVEINRHNGRGVEDEGLGLREDGRAGRRIGDGVGAVGQGVVGRVGPAGVVVAGVATPQVEEGRGVEVVGGPAAEEDLVVPGAAAGKDALVFLVHQAHIEAEFAVPHLLDGLGDEAENLGVVVENLDGREAGGPGVTGVGEELARRGRVVGLAGGRHVAFEQRRNKGRRRLPAAGEDLARDGVAIDAEREGAAHARVGERRTADVEAEEKSLELVVDAERGIFFPLQREHFRQRQRPGDVELAGAVGAFLRVDAVHGVEMDRIEPHAVAVVIGGGFFDDHALLRGPFLQHKRSA